MPAGTEHIVIKVFFERVNSAGPPRDEDQPTGLVALVDDGGRRDEGSGRKPDREVERGVGICRDP